MIQITFFKQNKKWMGFCSEGHAEYDEEGYDIVCAAVSALTQTILAALLEQTEKKDCISWKLQKGFLSVQILESLSKEEQEKAEILLRALRTGLKMIQEQYPEYVSVKIKRNGR